jgi:hypothetical protein
MLKRLRRRRQQVVLHRAAGQQWCIQLLGGRWVASCTALLRACHRGSQSGKKPLQWKRGSAFIACML